MSGGAGAAPATTEPSQARRTVFLHGEPFLNSRYVTVAGRRVNGGCAFTPPPLELPANERAISMRQVSIDYATCRVGIEIGKRLRVFTPPDGGSSDEAVGTPSNHRLDGLRGPQATRRVAATRSGFYEIRWLDRIDLTLNRTQAKLTWSYNGSCVMSWSPGAYWWWQSETGWSKDNINSDFWHNGGCSSYYSHATGVFWNDRFCGYVVGTNARDVRFRGGYAGGYGGQVAELWVTDSCQPLHYDADLWAS